MSTAPLDSSTGQRDDDVELPWRMRNLPTERHGRVIPWFVHIDAHGVPDFRVIGSGRIRDAYRFDLCWVCGTRRGHHAAFVIGPMCAVNRVSAEPPSHRECAQYSARVCPWLTTPTMTRRERGIDVDQQSPAGQMILRNPGVALVWSSKTWEPFAVPDERGGGTLFDIGDPSEVSWWAHGRPAHTGEVLASFATGMPLLIAEAEPQGQRALDALAAQHGAAVDLVRATTTPA